MDEYLEYLYVTGQLDSIFSNDKDKSNEDTTRDDEEEENSFTRTRKR